jgi:hypothetical protein
MNIDNLRTILNKWEQKGKIRKNLSDYPCTKSCFCSSCGKLDYEIYSWQNKLD